MKKTTVIRSLIALIIAGSLWSCKPRGAEYIDELDLVYTNYDANFDYKSRATFSLPDSIIKITGDGISDSSKVQFIDNTYAGPILASIRSNMISRGWKEVKKSENPDVLLLPSVSTTTNIYYTYNYGYYWGWYYPYYPYGGWYYPYYPSTVSGYRTGSLFVQMTSPKTPTPTGQLPVVWSAIFNGMLEGGTSYVTSRVQSSINQAFTQSPYLQH